MMNIRKKCPQKTIKINFIQQKNATFWYNTEEEFDAKVYFLTITNIYFSLLFLSLRPSCCKTKG
jgi:hypothetical protein